ncbi:unnamed protein product [Phytomonas sp. Hart1]|nr:unnamed protein product [Phytomonas sp. Hart1]|eukprot:CCW72135.1 unnamed protein product [Phytomonas sp. isolate Hart1]
MYQPVAMLLLSKPISQGYVASLPPPPSPSYGRRRQWMRAMDANSDVRAFYTPHAARYEAWYKEMYQLEDLGNGCAASGSSSNKLLDDSKNIQHAAEDYDLKNVQEELQYWSNEFKHLTQLKR